MKIMFEEVFPDYVHTYDDVISIPIIDTDEINFIIDKVRASIGKRPFYNEINGMEIDENGWYEARLILNKETGDPREIEAWVAEDCEAEDENENDIFFYHVQIEKDFEDIKKQVEQQLKQSEMTLADLRKIK